MFTEWLVLNTKQLDAHPFPELNINIALENFFNQEYRTWQTDKTINLFQQGRFAMTLFKERGTHAVGFGENEYVRIEKLADGSFDVYHGQQR